MNLFFKSYKFYIFFLLLVGLKSPLLLGQDKEPALPLVPEIINFEVPANFNRSPNTSLCRNEDGITFIGKDNGVFVADGNKYLFTPFPEPVFVGCSENNRVLYLTTNDIGYLDYSAEKGVVKTSRMGEIPTHFPIFYPYGITRGASNNFLLTSEGVFVVTDSSIQHFFFERKHCRLFNSGNHIYLQALNKGLYIWTGNDFKHIVPGNQLSGRRLNTILDWQNSPVMITENGDRLTIGHDSSVVRYAEDFPASGSGTLSFLYNDLFLDTSKPNEPAIFSATENTSYQFPLSDHTPGDSVKSVFVDGFNDIWIIYDFNICKIEYPSRTHTLDLSALVDGSILSSAILGEKIYLGTSGGILLIEPRGSDHYWVAKGLGAGLNGYVNSLTAGYGSVYATGSNGLMLIRNDSVVKISDQNCSHLAVMAENKLLTCSSRGLVSYEFDGQKWRESSVASGIDHVISEVWFSNKLWIMDDNGKILRLEPDGSGKEFMGNLPADSLKRLLVYNNELLLLGENHVFEYQPDNQSFEVIEFSEITKKLLDSDFVYGGINHLWSIFSNATGESTVWLLENSFIQTPYYEITAKASFGQVMDMHEESGYLWITGTEKIARLKVRESDSSAFNLLRIQSVELLSHGSVSVGRKISAHQEIRFGNQQVVFNMADLRYQKVPYPYYRYKLSGYQEEWSQWSRDNSISFNNLRERNYTFTAQSVSAYGQLSGPVSFSFVIRPPFYRTWYAYLVYSLILLSIAFLLYKWRLLSLKKVEYKMEERIRERMKAVLSEKEKSDKLVADLFPKGTAEELKSQGRAKSRKFEMVTVLFSDIQGFTKIAEEMNPEILIDELDRFFFHFDSVVDKYNIEKIKTIGDAYMAAGGIPVKNSSNPVEVVLAGLEMQYYMKELKKKKTDIWDLRIGIHTGPVISGVVGHKKLSYDIWGDTVNTASRMESSGEGGKVNISGITYSMVKDFFICEYRGKLPVKYKGNIDMYFVTGLRPELSVDLQGIPNRRFFVKLQLLKLKDIEETVLELIRSNTNLNLHFHKKEFIEKVVTQVELLGRSENIPDDDLLLIQTAGLLLYAGLSETYDNFENKSVDIAREILPDYGFSEKQIDRICILILATKEPMIPQNILESILIDAKMEFIGRTDYITQVKLLYLEKKNANKDFSKEKFIKKQKETLANFEFYTVAGKRLREISAEDQIENLGTWK